jgi:hypothetical protein
VDYLRDRALLDAQQNVARTWLWLNPDGRVGAYVTLSTTSVPTGSSGFRQSVETSKDFTPAVMIDQIAVADFVRREDVHLGYEIFGWTKAEVVRINRRVGARVIRLDVQLGNWSAFRTYRKYWGLRAMRQMMLNGRPYDERGEPMPLPDHQVSELPGAYNPDAYVKLWYDVYAPEHV